MRRTTGLILACITSATLAACGGGADPAPATSPATSGPAAQPVSSPATPTVTASPTPTCSGLTGAAAVTKWVGQVPTERVTGRTWDPAYADTKTYDPCAPLSWVTLPIRGATGSSPYQIMLFHQGRYIGTTLEDAPGFYPETTRLSPKQIAVTYTYGKPGQSTAAANGKARSTFTWDDAQGKVVRAGQLPPEEGEEDATSGQGTVPARGIPAGATRITAIRPKRQSYERETAVIITPSKNIGCDFTAEFGGCGVESYLEDKKYPEDEVGYPWWFSLDGGVPKVGSKGDAPLFDYPDVSAQVVQYGQTVYYGRYVCTSTQASLKCWNSETGHGVDMSRDGYRAF